VSVVGNSGSGKSRLAAQIAASIHVPYIELDAIHHLPGWQPIEPSTFMARIDAITATDGWVVDGNYRTVVMDGPVWRRADTVVWLDLPRRTVMRQVLTRTVRRLVRRQELWNGNRESWRNLYAWDPQRSIVRWAWTQHAKYRQRYGAAMTAPAFSHIMFVRLQSHDAAASWLRQLHPAEAP
jgi:adenylate kinase family enzyme